MLDIIFCFIKINCHKQKVELMSWNFTMDCKTAFLHQLQQVCTYVQIVCYRRIKLIVKQLFLSSVLLIKS